MKSKNYDVVLIDYLQKAYAIAPKSYKKKIASILMLYTFPSMPKKIKFKIIIFLIIKYMIFIALALLLGFVLMLLVGLLVV